MILNFSFFSFLSYYQMTTLSMSIFKVALTQAVYPYLSKSLLT